MQFFHENTFENAVLIEESLMTFLLIQIDGLNKTLIEKGIFDKELRKDICHNFFYCFSMSVDAGWLKEKDKKLYPLLGFAEREETFEMKNIYITKSFTSLNEYKVGLVEDYFGEMNEDIADIKKGFD